FRREAPTALAGPGAGGARVVLRQLPSRYIESEYRELYALPLRVRKQWREVFFMATGTVKWFNDAKGYGFIAPEDGSKDLFVHHTNVQGEGFKSLAEGAKVQYEAREGAKGPEATNVVAIGSRKGRRWSGPPRP